MKTKQLLITIIKDKVCFQSSNCEKTWGQAYRQECPLLNKYCTYVWVDIEVEYWLEEPRYEVNRHPDFVQKAIELFIFKYGEEELFDAVL